MNAIEQEGYDAGIEYHMNTGIKKDNPYTAGDQHFEAEAWDIGFEQAGLDS